MCVCVCVFLTGRVGAPAAWMLTCDLLKVLLFYFGGTACFSLFLPVTPSLEQQGGDEAKMRKHDGCCTEMSPRPPLTKNELRMPQSEQVELA